MKYKIIIGTVEYDANLCYEETFEFETKRELMAFKQGLDTAMQQDAWYDLENPEDMGFWQNINIPKNKVWEE